MLLEQYLKEASNTLNAAGIESARLDVLVLLEDILGRNRASLLAHPELPLTTPQIRQLNTYITQRKRHVPLAYIRGKSAFYGREFVVDSHVLTPRPESETMIELLLKYPDIPTHPRIADIGTGSGCLGITAALELPNAHVSLYDIDSDVLSVAQKNAHDLNAHVQLAVQNLLAGTSEYFDVILANLPYVPNGYPINKAAAHEPKLALFAGNDGLLLYRTFWDQITALETQPGVIFTESLGSQHDDLIALAKKAGYHLATSRDLIQVFAR